MIIKYFSDLHMELGSDFILKELFEDDLAQVFVIAGDLHTSRKVIKTLQKIDEMTQGKTVIFVPGNHEYYNYQRIVLDEQLRKLNDTLANVHILIESTHKVKNIIFAGSTGWWDGLIGGAHLYGLNDFSKIYDIRVNGNGTIWGRDSKEFFEGILKKNLNVVCVSHNAPSWKSINPAYMNSDINECFANHWDKLIKDYQPIAWIHGHMHDSCEYNMGKTQVLCNPYGYYGYEVNNKFNKTAYIQIT